MDHVDDAASSSSAPSIEVKTTRNLWHKAKDFSMNNCGIFDTGDNAKLLVSDYRIEANVVYIGDHQVTPSTLYGNHGNVHEGEAQATDQQSDRPEIPQNQNCIMPMDCEPETLHNSQLRTPVETDGNPSPSLHDPNNTLETVVTIDYSDPDALSNSSGKYFHVSRAPPHIYSFEMLMHGAGYPLYIPTPSIGSPPAHRKSGIRVGDVGVITANGAFDYIFNVCQGHDSMGEGADASPFPGCFEPPKLDIRVNKKFASNTYLPSDHVNQTDNHDSSPAFRCLAAQGAVLALPNGATVYEARNRLHFQTHAARHAVSWYEYMLNEGIDAPNGSLYLVTECTKSTDWGIAVFYSRPTVKDYLRFTSEGKSFQWKCQGKVVARVGSKSADQFDHDDGEPNQCTFVRGFKIKLRPDIWEKLKTALTATTRDETPSSSQSSGSTARSPNPNMSSGQGDSHHNNANDSRNTPNQTHNARLLANIQPMHMHALLPADPTNVFDASGDPQEHGSCPGQVVLEDNFGEAPFHPSDQINDMLLCSKPEAIVALVHDSVWCDHLSRDFVTDPIHPNISRLLENVERTYKPVVEHYGSVILVNMFNSPLTEPSKERHAVVTLHAKAMSKKVTATGPDDRNASRLRNYCRRSRAGTPVYSVEYNGRDWITIVEVDGTTCGQGQGTSKKEAMEAAAGAVLEYFGLEYIG